MGMMSEFKAFAMRGNVVEMAVGIVIGGAFGKIISSFVKDIVMPPIGLALGDVDFSKLHYVLKTAQGKAEAVSLNYGLFIMTLIDFIIIALAIFFVVRYINSLSKKEEEVTEDPKPSNEEILLTEIRDLLRK